MNTAPPDRARLGARLQELWQRFQGGQALQALPGLEEITRLDPGFADAWFALSFARLRLGDRAGALAAIERATHLRQPAPPAWQLHELMCLAACGRRDRGVELGRDLVETQAGDARFLTTLAQILFDLQQFDLARRAQQRALALVPGAAAVHLGLASIQLALGNLAAAEEACERCLDLDPGNADAIHLRAGLRRQTPQNNHVPRIRELLRTPPPASRAHARLLFALAKELEDLGDYEESFAALSEGARLYRGTLRFDPAEEIRFLDAVSATWTAERVRPPGPGALPDAPVPIFVAGLPRTGTTLVERILTAHSQVASAGELPDFSRRLSEMMEALPGTVGRTRAEMVGCSGDLDLGELGRRYLAQAAPMAKGKPWFTDKFPQNALYLGLIHRALPRAKLVLVWRHPMDTCYAMYKQLFTDIYQFSYDLGELAAYYVAYQRLMRHWVDVLGENLHVVHYEDVVEDQEGVSRRLLEFCGLPWEDRCLDFHRNPAPTSTASASQVRQAVYRTSVGRWRCYAEALAPLEERLRAAGCLDAWRLQVPTTAPRRPPEESGPSPFPVDSDA